jgi:hypothetical protein
MFIVNRTSSATTPRAFTNNVAITLISSMFLFTSAQWAEASPASDRAFGNCVTAAAAYFETRGHQVGTVTVLIRDADQHRLRITPAAADAEPAAIICTASRQTTAIEVIPTRLAVSNSAR